MHHLTTAVSKYSQVYGMLNFAIVWNEQDKRVWAT